MNASRSTLVKLAAVVTVAVGALAGAASASAGTRWSVGISAPGVVIGAGEPAPVYYGAAPVYSHPAPVYYRPAPPVVYASAPTYYGEGRRGYGAEWEGDRRWDRRDWNHRDTDRHEWRHERGEERRGWGERD